jgi:hypothetical protein
VGYGSAWGIQKRSTFLRLVLTRKQMQNSAILPNLSLTKFCAYENEIEGSQNLKRGILPNGLQGGLITG